MPIYTITHNCSISTEQKQQLAAGIKQIHCENTGAPAKFVQTIFHAVGPDDAYTAGEKNPQFLCLEGIIRPGRPEEVESKILWQLNDLLKQTLQPERYFISLGRFSTPHLIENGELLPTA